MGGVSRVVPLLALFAGFEGVRASNRADRHWVGAEVAKAVIFYFYFQREMLVNVKCKVKSARLGSRLAVDTERSLVSFLTLFSELYLGFLYDVPVPK